MVIHNKKHLTTWLSLPLRSESNENLDILSRKLQSIQDIDELTKMVSVDELNQ